MSELTKLLTSYCPNGVEYKKIGEIGVLFGGLTGKSKEDFKNGNAKFITYRNIYSNPSLDLNIQDKVKILDDEKQHIVRYGDILFTGSSETPDECGMSSVVTVQTNEDLYLNSFCFGLRLHNLEEYNLHFLKHLLRSNDVRGQIKQTASGVTRYNISKKRFVNISIPVPPIEVQTKIAEILDRFAEYAAELQAELQARQEQYEYYRNKLLNFNEIGGGIQSVIWMKMSEIGTFIRGNGLQKKDFTESGIPCIHYGQIYTHYGTFATKTKSYVSSETAKKCKKAHCGDLVFATVSENIDDVCKCVAWLGNEEICISGDSLAFSHNQNPKYIAYYFQTYAFARYKRSRVTGTKVIRLHQSQLEQFEIPIPSLSEQARIVNILDKFERLVSDLVQGLPAEIAAVKEQYEYYRNKLLSFPKYKLSA
ncbi:MAG: restriction endonuclease subunit S [Bacteroidales bacterium]|nr:restriction endonuclease subunit S [Bacteroidales bacterium]